MSDPLDNQVIYKLGTIEAQVKSINDNLITAIHRLEDKILDTARQSAENLSDVRSRTEAVAAKTDARVTAVEKRVDNFEDWKNMMVAKVSAVVALVTLIWALFGTALQQKLASIF